MEIIPSASWLEREHCPWKGEPGSSLTCPSARHGAAWAALAGRATARRSRRKRRRARAMVPCPLPVLQLLLPLLSQCQHRCCHHCCCNSCGQGLTAGWLWYCATMGLWDLCDLRALCDLSLLSPQSLLSLQKPAVTSWPGWSFVRSGIFLLWDGALPAQQLSPRAVTQSQPS